MSGNKIHGSSVVFSVVNEGGINMFLDGFVFISNSQVGVSVTIGLPYDSVKEFDFVVY